MIDRIVSPLLSSNMYIISENGHALLIDPCICEVDKLRCVTIDCILLTHEHYDHISGVNFWKNKTGAPLLCSEPCAIACQDPVRNISRYFSSFCDLQTWVELKEKPVCGDYICKADETFQGECVFEWQGHEVRLFECPGHSVGGTGIILDESFLFSGDSIIKGHPISCTMPGGSRKQWKSQSLPRLKSLNENIMVYPGHFDSMYLSEQKFE